MRITSVTVEFADDRGHNKVKAIIEPGRVLLCGGDPTALVLLTASQLRVLHSVQEDFLKNYHQAFAVDTDPRSDGEQTLTLTGDQGIKDYLHGSQTEALSDDAGSKQPPSRGDAGSV